MAEIIVTCYLQMEREALQVYFFVCLIIAVCIRPAWHGICPAADNPFPSIPAAAHPSLLRWTPSSPNLMPHKFFLRRYVKDSVFLPPLPQDLPELRRRIIAAIWEIDLYMLQQVWTEMDYRLDVRHVTKGRHIELLWGMQKNLKNCSSICRSHVTILSVIQVHRCHDICQGIKNNPVLCFPH